MLVLDRDKTEIVNIGNDIEVHVISIHKNKVRLGFKAPKSVQVYRNEVFRKIKEITKEPRGKVQKQSAF